MTKFLTQMFFTIGVAFQTATGFPLEPLTIRKVYLPCRNKEFEKKKSSIFGKSPKQIRRARKLAREI